MNKKLKRLLAAAVCIAMVMTSVQFPAGSVKAASGEAETTAISEANEAGMSIVSRKNYTITDGATMQRVVMRNSLGNQAVGHMTTINLSSDLTLKASYAGYYTAGSTAEQRSAAASSLSWGLAQTTQQAAAYEKAGDTEGTVVWGTNADFFNMQTGQPTGYLIMEGNVIQTGNTALQANEPYFAILKDGTAVIRDYGVDCSDVEEAISGPFYLVQNSQNVVDPNASDILPTNSVGIKADGSVVFLQIDGRQDPYSTGSTLYEIASLMKDAGCVNAIYLDGGGSATVAARVEGSDSLAVINSPSDGKERTVSSALLLVSKKEATGEFDHAVISPDVEQYTTGSTVTFTAEGADPSGAPADLPDSGLTWKLETKDAGKIDASTGEFTAAKSYVGDATVTLNYDNKQVGSATITLGEIDKLSFSSSSTSLDFATESDLGLSVESNLQEINYKDGDFKWTVTSETEGYSDDQIGTVTDNVFTSGPKTDTTLNGTATDPNGVTIPSTISTDEFDRYGLACGDFINGSGACSCWNTAPYGWDCTNDPGVLFHEMGYDWTVGAISSAADSAYNMYAKRVDSTTGEVRFGEHVLEFHYDYTGITGANNTNEYLCYTGDNIEIEGTPSAIGMWVYAPEGTPNYWFTMYLAYWNGSNYANYGLLHAKTTAVNAAGETVNTTTQFTGINWTGWQYVEFDLSGLYNSGRLVDIENHPLMIMQGSRLIDLIVIEGGTPNVDGNKITCGSRSAGSIYIDNVRAVYGTTVDDLDNPVITKVSAGAKDTASYDLAEVEEDGSTVINTNDVQIFAQYEDPQGDNASGIAEANTTISIDGQEIDVTANKDQAVAYATLPNGTHTMTITIMDEFGNKATKSYSFKVESDSEDALPSVDLAVSSGAELGKSIVIKASTDHAEDIASVNLTVKYGSVDTFDSALVGDGDAPFLTTADITYGSKYAGVDYTYVDQGHQEHTVKYSAQRLTTASKTVRMTAQKLDGVEGKDDVITFTMAVPNNLTANDSFPVTVYAEYTTVDGQTYTVASDVSNVPVVPAYTITADAAVSGAASDCEFKVLAVHQPAYYTNPKGSSQAFNKYIPSAAEAAGIDLVVSGHDHSYARTEKLTQNEVDEQNGVVYMICGDLGEKSREDSYAAVDDPNFHFAKVSQDYTSVYVSVTTEAKHMNVTVYDVTADGQTVLDQFTVGTDYCADGEHDFTYDKATDELCGPIWDVDSSMGLYGNSVSDSYAHNSVLFKRLLSAPAFADYVESIYNQYADAFRNASADSAALAEKISFSAGMNYVPWDFLGKKNCKKNMIEFKATYQEASASLSEWLAGRADAFIPAGNVRIRQSEGNINITVKGISDTSSLRVAIWSIENGQDDLKWVAMTQNSAGQWTATVPLRAFRDDGNFNFHFYNDANTIAAAATAVLELDYTSDPPAYLYNDMQNTGTWYYEAVANVTHKGLMTGLDSRTFGSAELTSRAQIAVILYRMAGSPAVAYQDVFSDVKKGTWYIDAVIWGYQTGVITGYQNGTFGAADNVTREQLVALLYRYAKAEAPKSDAISAFPDASQVSAFAKDAMNWAVSEGIITGKETNGTRELKPQDNTSRAEIAQMLTRL